MGESGQGLWQQIISSKYKVGNGGWCVPFQANTISGLWKSVVLVQVEFAQWVWYRVHDGLQVKLWHDEWCGQLVLSNQFPNHFLLDRKQQGFAAYYFSMEAEQVVWDFSFKRNLTNIEISDFAPLLGMLNNIYLSVNRSDVRLEYGNQMLRGSFQLSLFIMFCLTELNQR